MLNPSHMLFRDTIFQQAMHSRLEFQIIVLNFAAQFRNSIVQMEDRDAIVVKSRSISMLNEMVNNHEDHSSDMSIMAAAALAGQEVRRPLRPSLALSPHYQKARFGNKLTAWIHTRAVMQMIRNRGGPHTLGHPLPTLINWMDYFNNGYQEAGPDSPFIRCHSYCIPFSHPHNASVPHTLEELCNDFLSTLQNWEILSLSFRDASSPDLVSKHFAIFGPGSSLHRLLSHRKSCPNVKIVRLAILLHLVCALWDYRLSPFQTISFLDALEIRSPIFACCKTQHLATIL
jgi:hypothetical protein